MASSNASAPMGSPMPSAAAYAPSILDTFIPGYSILSSYVFESFGIDGSRFVPILVIVFSAAAAFSFLYRQIATDVGEILELFMSNIVIENKESIYDDFSKWISTKEVSELARTIRVLSPNKWVLGPQENIKTKKDESSDAAPSDATQIFNFSRAEASKPLRFEPYFGRYFFWHKGNFFMLEKYEKSQGLDRRNNQLVDKEYVKLSCLGLSTKPIKRLIEEARLENFENRLKTTRVFRPNNEISRRYGSFDEKWRMVAHRACRPIETINLEEKEKQHIIQDLNSFLQPPQANWYATKGIPYRRGYLFHGPPGTGKTSLSYALAGLFGVSIYGASLQDPDLTEEDLCELLNSLPSRCIVLLEDIDAAGLRRDLRDKEDERERKKNKDNPYRSWRQENKISLSGLLNAIDGVAAHEGHLLIMTSNAPEKLDDALKRPGRVDLQIEFTLATKVQVHDIFKRMYMTETAIAHPDGIQSNTPKTTGVVPGCFSSDAELEEAATKFTSHFEERQFSPAEIQGYLLFHKTEPATALEKVDEWIKTTLEAKEKEKKLREEQEAKEAKEEKDEDEKGKKKKTENKDKTSASPSTSASDEVSKAFAELLKKLANGMPGDSEAQNDDGEKETENTKVADADDIPINSDDSTAVSTNGDAAETKPDIKINGASLCNGHASSSENLTLAGDTPAPVTAVST